MNVLIGEVSSYKAIAIAKFIKLNYSDTYIYTYDTRSFGKKIITKYSDKHFIINRTSQEEELIKIIKEYKINHFFPVINQSLYKFWKRKEDLSPALDYLGNIEDYNILNDKIKLHLLAEQLNLLVPKRYASIDSAKIPYVVKPKNLSSSKGVLYIKSKSAEPKYFVNNDFIIQQFVEGVGVGYSFYCKEGKILNGYGHKRLAEYPISGGSSTYREEYENKEMLYIAEKIVGNLKYTGFAMFEYKLTPENEVYLIEVNPRIWGSINQGLVNGSNYFEGILGETDFTIIKKGEEIKTFLSPLFYVSIIKYAFRFNFKALSYFFKNIKNNKPDICLFEDPKGYFSLILRKFL